MSKKNESNSQEIKQENIQTSKKEYIPPEITTEDLLIYGAVCNGVPGSGRKTIAGPPDFCNPTKLLS